MKVATRVEALEMATLVSEGETEDDEDVEAGSAEAEDEEETAGITTLLMVVLEVEFLLQVEARVRERNGAKAAMTLRETILVYCEIEILFVKRMNVLIDDGMIENKMLLPGRYHAILYTRSIHPGHPAARIL